MGDTRLNVKNERLTDKPIGFVAAVCAHAVLIFGLISVFQWNTEPETFYAELWAPEDASGLTPEVKTPAPKVQEEPDLSQAVAEQRQQRLEQEAQIRLEEEQKQKKLEQLAREKFEAEKRAEQQRRLAEQKRQRERAEKERQEALRKAELARILGAATSTSAEQVGRTTGDMRTTTQSHTGTNQANYIAKVVAMLRSRIIYQVPQGLKSGERQAIYTVYLLPDGSQLKAPQLEQSSGLPAFDAAVESAIRRCNPFPPPDAGQTLPKTIRITFDPVDDGR